MGSKLLVMRRPARDRRLITWVIVGAVVALVVVAGVDALRSTNDEAAAPSTTAAQEATSTTAAGVERPQSVVADSGQRRSRVVEGVRFSFRVPSGGWESFGRISINKSIVGSQGAEAIIFWTSFPKGDTADPCADVLSPRVGSSVAALGNAVARAPGTKLVKGPSDVNVDGRAAMHVVLTVRKDAGCDPGFFYTWQAANVGALWTATNVGDTIRVWITEVGGTRLFIEAATKSEALTDRQANSQLEREIQQIIESIRFA